MDIHASPQSPATPAVADPSRAHLDLTDTTANVLDLRGAATGDSSSPLARCSASLAGTPLTGGALGGSRSPSPTPRDGPREVQMSLSPREVQMLMMLRAMSDEDGVAARVVERSARAEDPDLRI